MRLATHEPVHRKPGHGGERGRDVRIEEGYGGNGIHAKLAPRVETVPSEPQEAGAQGHQWNAVWALVQHPALTHIEHRGQRRHPCDIVNHDAAGKILHAP